MRFSCVRPAVRGGDRLLNVNAATACVLSCFAHAVGYAEESGVAWRSRGPGPATLWRPKELRCVFCFDSTFEPIGVVLISHDGGFRKMLASVLQAASSTGSRLLQK